MENFKDSLKCSNVLEIWISEDYDRDETIIRDDGKEKRNNQDTFNVLLHPSWNKLNHEIEK